MLLASATLVACVLAVPVTAHAQSIFVMAGAGFVSSDDLEFDTGLFAAGGVTFDPYIFGGGGLQGVSVSFPGFDSESDSAFGYQLGGGLVFGNANSSMRPYVEARYQGSNADEVDLSFFAVLVGLTFGAGN